MSYPTLSDLNSPSLISPFGARRTDGTVSPAAAMISTEPDFRYITGAAPYGTSVPFFLSTLFTLPGRESSVSIVGPYMGSPYGAVLLESLFARGSDTVLVLGWCGAISEDVKTGDIIVVESALSDEGTSRHYMASADDFPVVCPCPEATCRLEENLGKHNLSFHKGRIWTTDAIYRETEKKIDFFRKKGAIAVEMECAALFSVARYRQKHIAALLVVSDEVSASTWAPGFRRQVFKTARKRAADFIREVLLSGQL